MAGQKSVLTWRVDLRYILEREEKSRVLTWLLDTLCTYLLFICEFWQGLKRVCFCSFLLERIGRGNWFKNSCKQNCWSFLPLFFFFLIIFTNSFLLAWFYTTNSFYDCHLHIIILTRMHFYLIFILTPLFIIMPSQCVLAILFELFEFSNLFVFVPVFFSLASSLVSNFVNCAKSCRNEFVASLLKLLDFCSLYLLLFISSFCLPTY